jgi:hypothetical protein
MEIHDMKKTITLLLLAASGSLFAAAPDGYVVRVDSAIAYLDWGKASGVSVNQEFNVYRPGVELKHPVTGEVLGKTEEAVGQGIVQSVEEKYSIGQILEHSSAWKIGDRTRVKAAAPAPVSTTIPAATVPSSGSTIPVPKLLWASAPFAGTPRGIATGDLSGQGTRDVVVALKDRIDIYRWQTDHLEKIGAYKDRRATNWISVDIADLDHAGHGKIFATWYLDGIDRARISVLELSSATLKEVGHLDGFARAFAHDDGTSSLLTQDFSLSRELHMRTPQPITFDGKKYGTGDKVKLPRGISESQLFGFAWGDVDGDKAEDWAILENGDHLNIYFKDKKWRSEFLYGGTKLDFAFSNSFDTAVTLYPRLTPWKNAAGQEILLVPHNDSATGLRFSRLKIFRGGELLALSWNGLEMSPVWRVPTSSYLADYTVGAVSDAKSTDLWLLTESPGDKAVLSGYTLP